MILSTCTRSIGLCSGKQKWQLLENDFLKRQEEIHLHLCFQFPNEKKSSHDRMSFAGEGLS